MAKWNPKYIESHPLEVPEADYLFALEKASKVIYSIFCRLEATSYQQQEDLFLPEHKGLRK
jgi:hypothetical protein